MLQAQTSSTRIQASRLLLDDSVKHPLAQIASLSVFIQKYLRPNMADLEPEIIERLWRLSEMNDVDLRALALMSLHLSKGNVPKFRRQLIRQLKARASEEILIRKRWAVALTYLADDYRKKRAYKKALTIYRKCLEIMPDDPEILLSLGLTYIDLNEVEKAISSFQKVLSIKPYDSMAWLNLSLAYRRLGDIGSAVSSYQRAIEVNPHDALSLYNLGNHHYRNENVMEAIAFYKKAVKIDPSLTNGHFNLARAYIKNRDLRKAAISQGRPSIRP